MFPEKQFLKENKHLLIDSDSVKQYKAACPTCANVFMYSQVWTKTVDIGIRKFGPLDEPGWAVGECDICESEFTVPVVNPDCSGFSSGASYVKHIFEENISEDELLYIADRPKLTVALDSQLDMNARSHAYDYHGQALYECKACNAGLDIQVYSRLQNKFTKIFSGCESFLNWSLKNSRGFDPEHIIVRLPFHCQCGALHIAYIAKPYTQSLNFDETDFSICNVIGAKEISGSIRAGVYSKSQVMDWLYKLLPRWSLLFDTIYLIVPFVGHQFMTPETLVGTWMNLVARLDPGKVKFITRGGQLTSFKSAYQKLSNLDYDLLKSLELSSSLINDVSRNPHFHAKIYAAVSERGSEVYSGSANLLSGPSKEVMHFTSMNTSDFTELFLKPLSIQAVPAPVNDRKYSMLLEEESGFSAFSQHGTIYQEEYRQMMLEDIRPKREY